MTCLCFEGSNFGRDLWPLCLTLGSAGLMDVATRLQMMWVNRMSPGIYCGKQSKGINYPWYCGHAINQPWYSCYNCTRELSSTHSGNTSQMFITRSTHSGNTSQMFITRSTHSGNTSQMFITSSTHSGNTSQMFITRSTHSGNTSQMFITRSLMHYSMYCRLYKYMYVLNSQCRWAASNIQVHKTQGIQNDRLQRTQWTTSQQTEEDAKDMPTHWYGSVIVQLSPR